MGNVLQRTLTCITGRLHDAHLQRCALKAAETLLDNWLQKVPYSSLTHGKPESHKLPTTFAPPPGELSQTLSLRCLSLFKGKTPSKESHCGQASHQMLIAVTGLSLQAWSGPILTPVEPAGGLNAWMPNLPGGGEDFAKKHHATYTGAITLPAFLAASRCCRELPPFLKSQKGSS